ncbi:MAG: DUF971 domain-containing protein [Candidatus Eisenbacteria bacterium]|nr:DUF971 domain-containing protein [Candidatus Latescibacterota bacterium]MBD3301409.1 DUF971 domain-containing protein [Candidatus Eisenbacteria bacterium]
MAVPDAMIRGEPGFPTNGGPMEPKIEVGPDALWIEWPDGHQSRYPFERLRALCPCASCAEREVDSGGLRVIEQPSERAVRLSRLERVGNYALCPIWEDGHSTGIYAWTYLRRSCDCFACRSERRGEER